MPIIHNVAQRSEYWELLRLGLPTGSNIHKIWTTPSRGEPRIRKDGKPYKNWNPLGRESDEWEAYAHDLLSQRIMLDRYDDPVGLLASEGRPISNYMMRGTQMEDEAAAWYELSNDVDIQKVGFITTNDGKIGCSPDGLVGDDGMVEVKCPARHTHLTYVLHGEVGLDYWQQQQTGLYVCERKWVDVVSYHPLLPRELRACIRVVRDEPYIAAMIEHVYEVCNYLDGLSERFCPEWLSRKREKLERMLDAATPSLSEVLRVALDAPAAS